MKALTSLHPSRVQEDCPPRGLQLPTVHGPYEDTQSDGQCNGDFGIRNCSYLMMYDGTDGTENMTDADARR